MGGLFVFGGPSRFSYHGVPKTYPGTADLTSGLSRGRINVTLWVTGLRSRRHGCASMRNGVGFLVVDGFRMPPEIEQGEPQPSPYGQQSDDHHDDRGGAHELFLSAAPGADPDGAVSGTGVRSSLALSVAALRASSPASRIGSWIFFS